MKEKVKDVLIRSLKTFWQATASYLITTFGTSLAGIDVFDIDALKNVGIGLLIGSLAAGLSATWNGGIQPVLDKAQVNTVYDESDKEDDINS